jgi:hypothetical protein
MARVLNSYRREDTAGHAGRLYDVLVEHFGSDPSFPNRCQYDPRLASPAALTAFRCGVLNATTLRGG